MLSIEYVKNAFTKQCVKCGVSYFRGVEGMCDKCYKRIQYIRKKLVKVDMNKKGFIRK